MAARSLHPPRDSASDEGVIDDASSAALGDALASPPRTSVGEIVARRRARERSPMCCAHAARRARLPAADGDCRGRLSRARAERFEVVYHLLSLTKNHRLRVRVATDEETPVPTVTDVYGRSPAGSSARCSTCTACCSTAIPTCAGSSPITAFDGHPHRKDFPLTGYVELRYSEEQKRVVYEPVDARAGFPHLRLHEPVGRRRIHAARRREGASPRRPARRRRSRPTRSKKCSAQTATPPPTPKTHAKPSRAGRQPASDLRRKPASRAPAPSRRR